MKDIVHKIILGCLILSLYIIFQQLKDATKYAALKRELKRSIEEIQVTTRYSALDKIFMIRSLSLVFEENIKKIGCDEVIDEI